MKQWGQETVQGEKTNSNMSLQSLVSHYKKTHEKNGMIRTQWAQK